MSEEEEESIVERKVLNHFKRKEIPKENSLYSDPTPKYFLGSGNNAELIENLLKSIGYERQNENNDEFKLKWVQCNNKINWNIFKDGEQMVNHIQGEDYFTTKLQLYQSLQTYQKISMTMIKYSKHFLPLNQFVPQTFKLDEKSDRDLFFNTHQPGDVWICKPSGLNQGKGIYLVREIEELKQKFSSIDLLDKRKQVSIKPMKTIIQRYIINPLLIHGKKFDIRCFMLISSVNPLIIFYHSGYIRLSMFHFDANDQNLLTHLTNQYMQKKDPKYSDLKEETSWTMEQFNEYLNSTNKKVEQNWVIDILPKIIHRIMLNVIESIRMRLKKRVGSFGLYGYDFMIDEDMKVWLIEINVNPALTTNTNTLIQTIPPVVKESILLSIECFEKIRHSQKIFPLKSLKGFKCIYNENERKSLLSTMEQKRQISSSSNTRKVVSLLNRSNENNSSKSNKRLSEEQKLIVSYSLRQTEDQRERLLTPSTTNSQPFIMKYKTNLQILKPTKITVEHFNDQNLDKTKQNYFSTRPKKSLVLISKSPNENKSIQT